MPTQLAKDQGVAGSAQTDSSRYAVVLRDPPPAIPAKFNKDASSTSVRQSSQQNSGPAYLPMGSWRKQLDTYELELNSLQARISMKKNDGRLSRPGCPNSHNRKSAISKEQTSAEDSAKSMARGNGDGSIQRVSFSDRPSNSIGRSSAGPSSSLGGSSRQWLVVAGLTLQGHRPVRQ